MLRNLILVLAATAPFAAPCDAAAHRAFDFWLGDWNVYTTTGKLAGTNLVTREYGGCVVHEHYQTAHGYSGESLNIYDASRQRWHQSWVDSSGTLLMLAGQAIDHGMRLEGTLADKDGKPTPQRITWTANADGSVRQLWEQADSTGKWSVVFDGLYKRKDK